MQTNDSLLKRAALTVMSPARAPLTWASREGLLPPAVRKSLPWRWSLEPFTLRGEGWSCEWWPTDFDAIGHQLCWGGFREWEKETVPVIIEQLKQARYFIDVGANCGIYSVIGCKVNPQLQAVAIEPVPKIYCALERNITKNHLSGRIRSLNLAVGNSSGQVPFHEAEDATMGSLATDGYQGQKGNVITVDCRTLDSIVQDLQIAPDFLKIDVEGFEHAVLEGASWVLSKHRPKIVLESNPGDPSDRVSEILIRQRYEFWNLTDEGLKKHSEIHPAQNYRNWLCVPEN